MTELAWTAVRNDTIRKYNGQPPRAQDEATIIEIFTTLPNLVLTAIDETAELVQAGKVKYGWSFLAARLTRGATPLEEVTVDMGSVRTKKIAAAERWFHNAGCLMDERDIQDELFGRNGMLHAYADDQHLQTRITERWQREQKRLEEQRANEEPPGRNAYRQLQWLKAHTAGERWATADDTWEDYEAEREAGHRPFWRGGPPVPNNWPRKPAALEIDDDPEPGTPEWHAKQAAAA